jgi:D-glycero-D-manno-heptose 1,7-bisphosphate phosphatase
MRGLQAAVDRGLRTVAFTGATGGDCLAIAEHCLRIPSAGHRAHPGVHAAAVPRDLRVGRARGVRVIRWALLDRDGTISVGAPEGDYIRTVAELALLPDAADAVRRLNAAGLPVAVVTNQRGVALGLMSEADLDAVNERLRELLAAEGARLDAVYCCPHGHDACDCRKPLPGLLTRAAAELGLPLADAVMVGDTEVDVEAGRAAGCGLTIRLAPPGTATVADRVGAVVGGGRRRRARAGRSGAAGGSRGVGAAPVSRRVLVTGGAGFVGAKLCVSRPSAISTGRSSRSTTCCGAAPSSTSRASTRPACASSTDMRNPGGPAVAAEARRAG